MWRLTRLIFLLIVAVSAAPVYAAQGSTRCIGPGSPSALNQYCEDIPSATGGSTPGAPGTSSVGTTLPRQVAQRIQGTRLNDPRRKLLTIPAGGNHRHSHRASRAAARAAAAAAKLSTKAGDLKTSPSSIGLGLILVLVLSGLALVGLAFERWRRSSAA